eukprot:3864915-Rhodomonas_salina.1
MRDTANPMREPSLPQHARPAQHFPPLVLGLAAAAHAPKSRHVSLRIAAHRIEAQCTACACQPARRVAARSREESRLARAKSHGRSLARLFTRRPGCAAGRCGSAGTRAPAPAQINAPTPAP